MGKRLKIDSVLDHSRKIVMEAKQKFKYNPTACLTHTYTYSLRCIKAILYSCINKTLRFVYRLFAK